MITINPSSLVIIYVMTATNTRLLISESHGGSNRCTPCKGKPDQHGTRFPCSVHVWFTTIHISRGPHIATFCMVINRFEQIHYTRDEGLSTQSTACRLTDLWVYTQVLSHNRPWSSGEKSSFCWHLTTRLTGPISPACDWYIQYLLVGANPSVHNRHRWDLQLWRCRLTTYHSPTLPTSCLHFPPMGPRPVSSLTKLHQLNQSVDCKELMAATWSFDDSAIYHSLHLYLAIVNDLSLVTGVVRIDRKVVIMQLGINSTPIT
jgi:hypothetical protein